MPQHVLEVCPAVRGVCNVLVRPPQRVHLALHKNVANSKQIIHLSRSCYNKHKQRQKFAHDNVANSKFTSHEDHTSLRSCNSYNTTNVARNFQRAPKINYSTSLIPANNLATEQLRSKPAAHSLHLPHNMTINQIQSYYSLHRN